MRPPPAAAAAPLDPMAHRLTSRGQPADLVPGADCQQAGRKSYHAKAVPGLDAMLTCAWLWRCAEPAWVAVVAMAVTLSRAVNHTLRLAGRSVFAAWVTRYRGCTVLRQK